MPIEHQVAIMLAVTQGLFDEIPVEEVKALEESIINHLSTQYATLLEEIKKEGILNEKVEKDLLQAIKEIIPASQKE